MVKLPRGRIVLLPANGDLFGPHEEILATRLGNHVHVQLRMLSRSYSSSRVLAAEWESPKGFYRWLWRRGEK